MQKIIIALFLMTAFSLTAFAAKYKVNTSGQVTAPTGQVQKGSVLNQQTNIYNNYYAPQYVNSRQVLQGQVSVIDIVMDYSGSMYNWTNEAKNSMSQIIAQLPASTSIGFRVFGHNGMAGSNNLYNPYKPALAKVQSIIKSAGGKYKVQTKSDEYLGSITGSCSATAQVTPVATNNLTALLSGMNSIYLGGSTPLTYGLYHAVNQDFSGISTQIPKKIVLITDGGENCGGDPCEFARELVRKRNDIHIDVVLVSSTSQKLRCLADTTGGKMYTTNDLSSFSNILIESMQTPPAQIQMPEPEKPQQNYEYIDD